MGRIFGNVQRMTHGRRPGWLFYCGDAGFVNGPAKCGAPNPPCNRERKMGLARL